MAENNLYTENSIESLSPLEFTRLKPGVYAGDTTYSTQLLIEIISNAVDEFRLGHGTQIDVDINSNNAIRVRDYGQGFLVNEMREDGKTVLEAAFSVLNTSGKYREDGTYEGTSLGSFGIGSKITNFLSNWLDVYTYRDGYMEHIHFTEGVFESREIKNSQLPSGTCVEWLPSKEFFTHQEIEIDKIKNLFETLVALCPGLQIHLNNKGEDIKYFSKNGINDLVDKIVLNKELIKNRFNMSFAQGKNKMDMVLTYSSIYSFNIVPYVNTGLTESGQHITQVKTIITREFNKFFKEKKWLKEKDDNLSGDDIQEGMCIIFNITAPNVSYDAQVKSRITKIDMTPFNAALVENLHNWFTTNEKEIKIIFEKAAAARKARDAAKKARDAARGQNKKKQKALKFDSKLADCNSKDRQKCEIYITEGKSASGNLKLARNNETQAVIPVRGKILNTQKATFAQIQKNAEIMTMCDAFFGPGDWSIDPKTLKVKYNQVRYGKIIIMSDADVDGAHIKNLFYTFIWNFCPDLIINGYIYAGVPPLYKITLGANKGYKYLKNDEALIEFQNQNKGKKYQVGRMKGLGEMDVEEIEETLTDPNNRIIKQINVEDIAAADKLFNDLMGNAVIPRKKYIKDHSMEATYNAE